METNNTCEIYISITFYKFYATATKEYELALKALDIQMTKIDNGLNRLYEHSDKYISKLKEKQKLIKEEIELNKQQISMNKSLSGELTNIGMSYGAGVGSNLGKQVVENATRYLGTPYVWGGKSPSGFDCSGLVQYVYKQVGIKLGGDTYSQIKQGRPVSRNQLQPGDSIFFGTPSDPHHVGMYMGNNKFIEAPHKNSRVRIANLSNRSDYLTARRYISGGSSSSGMYRSTGGSYSGKYADLINEASNKYGVSPALIAGIIQQESSFNPRSTSSPGAKGLMQLMPETARELGVSNPYDPRQSIMGGTKEIARLLKKYNGNLDMALAGYNAGEGAVARAGGIPNNHETRDYIPKVKKYMQQFGGSGNGVLGSESSIHSVMNEQYDLLGKNMDLEKKNLNLTEQLNQINIQILEAKLGQFDDKVKSIDRTIGQLKTDADLQTENDVKYINYLSKIDDYAMKKLDTLKKEREFILKEQKSGIYDEKTMMMLQQKNSDLGTQMLNVKKEIQEADIQLVEAKWEAIQTIYKENIEQITNELDRLSLHEEKNLKKIMIMKNQVIEQDEANIKRITALIRETNNIAYKYGKDWLMPKVREYTAELDKANTELEQHKKELDDIKDKISELKGNIEDKIKEVFQKVGELNKEQLDKMLEHFNDNVDKAIKKLDDAKSENDYREQETEQLKTIADLQEKIAKLSLDDSEEGIARKIEYEKQLQEEMKKKNDLQMEHGLEEKKDKLNKLKDDKQKETDKKKKEIDASLDNVYLNLNAKKALTEGYIEWINGKRISLESALLQFIDLYGNGLSSLGDKIKKELLEQLHSAQNLLKDIKDGETPDKILEKNKTRNVYGSGTDLANARKILGSMGYNYIDTRLVDTKKLHFGKNDIIVGDTKAIRGVSRQDLGGATRLGGKNRYDTAGIIQLYSDIQAGRIKPIDGIVYGTGQDLRNAMAWLSPMGYEFIDTSKIDPRNVNFNPNDIIVGGKGSKGGVNFDVDDVTRLGGKNRQDTYNKIRNDALTKLNKMNKENYVPSTKYGKVYGTGADLTNAKKYLTKLGYQFVDTKSVQDINLTANDIVVGGGINGKEQIYNSNARWLFGSDRYKTANEIANFANTMSGIKGYYSKGGVNDFTGKAMLHGSPSAVETVFNAEQGRKLYNFVKGLPSSYLNGTMNRYTNMQTPTMSTVNNSNQIVFNVDKMVANERTADNFATRILNNIRTRGGV